MSVAEILGHLTLSSGMHILWDRVNVSHVVSVGFFYPSGSRNDPPGQEGVAHFVEHFVFKGTQHFTASSLARRIDQVGGDLNAYTDRNEMGFTCTVPADAWQTAFDSLIELCLFPTFPASEFEKEKSVILNEIRSSDDDPEELSYDDFLSMLDPGHPELRPVAGNISSVSNLTLNDVIEWSKAHLGTANLVACWSGPLDPDEVAGFLKNRIESLITMPVIAVPIKPIQTRPFFQSKVASFKMVQLILGFHRNVPIEFEEWIFLQTFSILWGETMGSRLFQRMREELGLCYSVSSQVWDAVDSAGIHTFITFDRASTSHGFTQLRNLVTELQIKPPTPSEWTEAKNAFRGSMILGNERMESRTQRLFTMWSRWEKLHTTEDLLGKILDMDHEKWWPLWAPHFEIEHSSILIWGKGTSKILKRQENSIEN